MSVSLSKEARNWRWSGITAILIKSALVFKKKQHIFTLNVASQLQLQCHYTFLLIGDNINYFAGHHWPILLPFLLHPLWTRQAVSLSTLPLLIPFPQFTLFTVKRSRPFCLLSLHDCFASALHLKVSHFPICLGSLQLERQVWGWPLSSEASLLFFFFRWQCVFCSFGLHWICK